MYYVTKPEIILNKLISIDDIDKRQEKFAEFVINRIKRMGKDKFFDSRHFENFTLVFPE